MWNRDKREYEFLKLYIHGDKKNKTIDEENLKLAIELRDKKELELFQKDNSFNLMKGKSKADFVEYFKNISDSKPLTEKAWRNTYKHLHDFTNDRISFKEIDENFCQKFKKFLFQKISQNNSHTYFSKIKCALNQAVKENIISKNPSNNVQIKKEDTERDFLTEEEIKALKVTECNKDLKNSFLFACNTGLRLSDIKNLKYENVSNNYLSIKQKKTKETIRMKLNAESLKIIDEQRNNPNDSEKIFNFRFFSKIVSKNNNKFLFFSFLIENKIKGKLYEFISIFSYY